MHQEQLSLTGSPWADAVPDLTGQHALGRGSRGRDLVPGL